MYIPIGINNLGIVDAIRRLRVPALEPEKKIGFQLRERRAAYGKILSGEFIKGQYFHQPPPK